MNYFCAIALWKLWKNKIIACCALVVAHECLWKTCGKAGKSRSPFHFPKKTVLDDGVTFSTK
ncbi:MAG: hypothetical protein ACMG55_14780 [Microcoleus sp.]